MNDGITIALASIFVAGITAGPPLYIQAFRTRQVVVQAKENAQVAADAAQKVQETIGTKNGNGDLMQMAARALGENSEIFKQILELYNYTHFNVHEIYAALTVVRGMTDILWDKADLPPMTHPQRRTADFTPMVESLWQKISDQAAQAAQAKNQKEGTNNHEPERQQDQ